MNDTLISRLIVALLFAIAFTLIGWTTPIIYASHAPQENFIEVHNFDVQDANPAADKHYICFDRTVKTSTSGTVYTELYLVNGDTDERVEIGSQDTTDRYFQQGTHQVLSRLKAPDNLAEGEYRYLLVVELRLAEGRVDRNFAFESQKFTLSDDEPLHSEEITYRCEE